MVPCTEKGPARPTGLMKAAGHCERATGHSGDITGRLGEVLALGGRMPCQGRQVDHRLVGRQRAP